MNAPRYQPRNPHPMRLHALLVVLAGSALWLVGTAFSMQVLHQDFYQGEGDARTLRDLETPASRGQISDRNGEPLAISTPMVSLWAEPKVLSSEASRLPELASALDLPLATLSERLQAFARREFVYLRRRLPPDQAERVLALKIAGVHAQREYRRFYPGGEVFAQLLGSTNIDDQGIEGLELSYEAWLRGQTGVRRVVKDLHGASVELVDVEEIRAAEPGRELRLSIDRRLQYLAYRGLKSAVFENSATSASMVILDAPSGEILAMANYPSFNPNAAGNPSPKLRRNSAVTDLFEPGSVVKAFTVAAGLESGKFTTRSTIDTHPGSLRVGKHVVHDILDYGVVDLTRLITKSSNVGATRIALALDDEHLYDMFHRFGFGEASGTSFPGEETGRLPTPQRWSDVEKATLSYGYGLSVNCLQLATAYATLANGGMQVKPTFILGQARAGRESRLLDPAIAESLLGMLETVTGPDGGGTRARVPNFRVAGKTGTARKSEGGGYSSRYNSVFVGIVPVARPRLVAVVVIHDPSGSAYYGGLVAAPVFGQVMPDALRLLNIAPDDLRPESLATGVPGGADATLAAALRFDPANAAEGVAP